MIIELIDKETINDKPIKVRDVFRWLLDSKAVRFLLMTESAYSINELKKIKKSLYFKNTFSDFSKESTVKL